MTLETSVVYSSAGKGTKAINNGNRKSYSNAIASNIQRGPNKRNIHWKRSSNTKSYYWKSNRTSNQSINAVTEEGNAESRTSNSASLTKKACDKRGGEQENRGGGTQTMLTKSSNLFTRPWARETALDWFLVNSTHQWSTRCVLRTSKISHKVRNELWDTEGLFRCTSHIIRRYCHAGLDQILQIPECTVYYNRSLHAVFEQHNQPSHGLRTSCRFRNGIESKLAP